MDMTGTAGPPVRLDPTGTVRQVRLDEPPGSHTIDDALIDRLHSALDEARSAAECRVLLLTSAPGVFSIGMDLAAAAKGAGTEPGAAFFDLLRRFTTTPLIVTAAVDGQVAGGGVGLVAAADLVFATPRSTFALPEALWGLLPCCVLPFLIRRTGFQKAYAMALTTWPVTADVAVGCGLVDELADELDEPVRRLAFRASRLDPSTLGAMKRYGGDLWPVTDETRGAAVRELGRLMALPEVRDRLVAFAEHRRFPWQT